MSATDAPLAEQLNVILARLRRPRSRPRSAPSPHVAHVLTNGTAGARHSVDGRASRLVLADAPRRSTGPIVAEPDVGDATQAGHELAMYNGEADPLAGAMDDDGKVPGVLGKPRLVCVHSWVTRHDWLAVACHSTEHGRGGGNIGGSTHAAAHRCDSRRWSRTCRGCGPGGKQLDEQRVQPHVTTGGVTSQQRSAERSRGTEAAAGAHTRSACAVRHAVRVKSPLRHCLVGACVGVGVGVRLCRCGASGSNTTESCKRRASPKQDSLSVRLHTAFLPRRVQPRLGTALTRVWLLWGACVLCRNRGPACGRSQTDRAGAKGGCCCTTAHAAAPTLPPQRAAVPGTPRPHVVAVALACVLGQG